MITGLKGTFKQGSIVQRTKSRNKTGRTERESGELSGEFPEYNTVERARLTEIDARTEFKKSGQALFVYVKDVNRNIPTTWK